MARLKVRELAPAGATPRPIGVLAGRSAQLPVSVWQVGAFSLALAIGLLAGVQPKLAVAAVIALVFAAIVVTNLAVGLVALVALAFFEDYSTLAGGVSLTKLVGLLLALALLARIAAGRPEERESRDLVAQHRGLVVIAILFMAWAVISLAWAERWNAGTEPLGRFLLNFALFPIAFAALRTRRHVVWLFSVFVASALLSVVFGLLHPA